MTASKNKEQTRYDVVRLIKEKESANQAAHINEIFLKNITHALPQYVFWKDVYSVYLGCNKNYATLVGLKSPEDIVGKTDNDLNWQPVGHTVDTFQKGDQDTIAGHYITNQEEVLALPNGKTLITLVSKLPIIDDNKVIGIVGYFTDITELKNKENELIKAKKLAESANEAKSAFMTNISHDIRTPLTGVIGMTRILLKELKSKQGREAAYNILMAGNALLNLLNEVIEFTKLGAEDLPLNEVKFSMKEVIHNIIMLETPSAHEKKLQLIIHYDDRVPNYLIGDQKRIHRILLNIISNAIKFTPQGTVEISVKVAKRKGKNIILKVFVKDTGIGITPENQQIIFSRFSRLESAYKGNYKGSGLGLSIVKQFISEIDGEVYVESKENEGATFTCIFPLKKALLDEAENKANLTSKEDLIQELESIRLAAETAHPLPFSAKILLVEDHKIAQLAVKNLLQEMQCEVVTADTGEAAFELFKKDKFDLIFMDMGLPGKNGCEITREMRKWEKQNNQHTPIIALTAHIDEDNKQQCLNAGMENVVTKPLKDEAASSILNTFVYHSKQSSAEERKTEEIMDRSLPVIDISFGAKITGSTEAAARDMLKLFVETLPEIEKEIKLAYQSKDFKTLQFVVHKLHGGTCYCGVPRLKMAARKFEEILKAKSTTQIDQGYTHLCHEISNVLQEYKRVQ